MSITSTRNPMRIQIHKVAVIRNHDRRVGCYSRIEHQNTNLIPVRWGSFD